MVKNTPVDAEDARDAGLIPGSGRSPEGENGNPLQDSCLENPMDRGAWQTTVHRVEKNQELLSTHVTDIHHIHESQQSGGSIILN